MKNDWNPGIWVLIWVLRDSYLMNTNMTGFRLFFKKLCILMLWMKVTSALDESSLSIGRVKGDHNILRLQPGICIHYITWTMKYFAICQVVLPSDSYLQNIQMVEGHCFILLFLIDINYILQCPKLKKQIDRYFTIFKWYYHQKDISRIFRRLWATVIFHYFQYKLYFTIFKWFYHQKNASGQHI